MNRCGHCKSYFGKLIPIVVRSRGREIHTHAHLDCILPWRQVSIVEPDPSRIAPEQMKWLNIELRETELELAHK